MVVGIPSSLVVVDLVVVVVELGMAKSLVGLVDDGLENRDDLVERHHVVGQSLVTVLGSLVDLESRWPVVGMLVVGYQGSPSGSMENLADSASLVDC